VLPLAVADEDAGDGAAEPGKVLEHLLLRLAGDTLRARAQKRRRNRRVHVVLVRSVLPEHPRYALVVRRRVTQHWHEVCRVRGGRGGRARGLHAQRLRQRGRVDARDGHIRRVPLQRPEQRPLARAQLADVLYRRMRDPLQPEPALVYRLCCQEERRRHRHHWPLEEDAERAGVAAEGVARLREHVPTEVPVPVEFQREGHRRRVRMRLLLALTADEDEMRSILSEERGVRSLARGQSAHRWRL